MAQRETYDLFISHAWRYHDDYMRMVNLLNEAPSFSWRNYSVPRQDPLHAGHTEALKQDLRKQIRPVNAIVVLAGIYATHSGWIQFEIDYARDLGKPILGVRPWGSERISQAVREASDEIVGWNTSTIVGAIRRISL